MKIKVVSDLHLEFDTIEIKNNGADVLILSGDICVAVELSQYDAVNVMGENTRSYRYHNFFQQCSENFPHVLYVAGNHEHYHGDYKNTISHIRKVLSYLPNVHVLDKETFVIDDITFIGGTLWTDMNNEDPITLMHMSGMMNDFRCVKNSNREVNFKDHEGKFHTRVATFSPEDAVKDHEKMMEYVRLMIEGKFDQKFVVVGHHAPSKQSTHPRYKNEIIMNGGYSSSLDEFILDHPQIKLWTHGHTHEVFDYMIGSTRIVCNPRGYANYEENISFNPEMIVEV